MPNGTVGLIVGIVLILMGKFMWKKGSDEEGILLSLLGAILDLVMFDFNLASGRTISILLFLGGIITFLISILYMLGIISITSY